MKLNNCILYCNLTVHTIIFCTCNITIVLLKKIFKKLAVNTDAVFIVSAMFSHYKNNTKHLSSHFSGQNIFLRCIVRWIINTPVSDYITLNRLSFSVSFVHFRLNMALILSWSYSHINSQWSLLLSSQGEHKMFQWAPLGTLSEVLLFELLRKTDLWNILWFLGLNKALCAKCFLEGAATGGYMFDVSESSYIQSHTFTHFVSPC